MGHNVRQDRLVTLSDDLRAERRPGGEGGGVGDLGLIRRATSQIIISNLHHIDCSSQEQVNYVSIEL